MSRELVLAAGVLLFAGCSWTESFVVSNETSSNLRVEYELGDYENGLPIFERHPDVCPLDSSGNLDWGARRSAEDTDPRPRAVSVDVPAGQAIIFGRLSNDEYHRHDQEFINDRRFNLKRMTLSRLGGRIEITPENFDSLFRKDGRLIRHRLR